MYIHVTETAASELMKYAVSPEDRIRLVYDSEGCGCAVSGVASLWIDRQEEPDEARADSNAALPLYFFRRQEVFFDDRMRLDYSPERRAYRLSSDGQIYGSGILVSDRRAVRPASADAPR